MTTGARRRSRGSFRINGRGWVFLVLTLAVLLAAGLKENNLLFAIFSALAGLFAASAALTFLVARRVEIARFAPAAATAGEPFTVGVKIRNAKRFWPAFCLKFEDRMSHEGRAAPLQPSPVWLPLAPPRGRARGSYYATAQERGWAKLGPFTLTSEFLPGLFTYRTRLTGRDSLLVYPPVAPLNRRVLSPLLARIRPTEPATRVFAAGDEEFAGLREYRPGDNPRRIHWKMSARFPGKLLLREFENAKVRDAVLLLETFIPSPNDARRRARLERAVAFSASLADALLAEGFLIRFRAFAPDPVTLALEPGRDATEELLAALAILKPSRIHPMGDLLAPERGSGNDVFFVLRIGNEPLPPWDPLSRAIVLGARDMQNLLEPFDDAPLD